MERAAKFDPGFREINKKYWELAMNKTLNECIHLYLESFGNYMDYNNLNNELDVNELFD